MDLKLNLNHTSAFESLDIEAHAEKFTASKEVSEQISCTLINSNLQEQKSTKYFQTYTVETLSRKPNYLNQQQIQKDVNEEPKGKRWDFQSNLDSFKDSTNASEL